MRPGLLALGALIAACGCWLQSAAGEKPAKPPASPALFSRHLADYDAELRQSDGRVDIDGMVQRLSNVGVTTYYWLVWHAPTDWDDLKLFLPKAAAAHISVWVYLVPPTESPPHYGTLYSEPFRLDYGRWAQEIARLSLQETNLTAWVVDDFYANHQFFSPSYLRQMQARARSINPQLAFLPLMYFNEISRQFADDYHSVIDGVVVAYPRDREEISDARTILNGRALALPGELSCPWNTPTVAGDSVSAGVLARVLATNDCRLRFREQDDFTGPTAGYHFKQVLVDEAVVWEQDVAGGTAGWHEVDVDLTSQVSAGKTAVIAFRLLDKKGVSNFGVRWRLRDLRGEGLQPVAGFNEPKEWRVKHRGPFDTGFGQGGKTNDARIHIPFIVMTAANAGEFRQRHGEPASPERIAAWLRMCLEARSHGDCEGVVTYCLDKSAQSATFPLAQELFGQFGNPPEGR